jgi:hypothetical protein
VGGEKAAQPPAAPAYSAFYGHQGTAAQAGQEEVPAAVAGDGTAPLEAEPVAEERPRQG